MFDPPAAGDIAIDFRAYKIPGPERRAIINRWYMVTLRCVSRLELEKTA